MFLIKRTTIRNRRIIESMFKSVPKLVFILLSDFRIITLEFITLAAEHQQVESSPAEALRRDEDADFSAMRCWTCCWTRLTLESWSLLR